MKNVLVNSQKNTKVLQIPFIQVLQFDHEIEKYMVIPQQIFTCSKSTVETLEKFLNYF